MGQDQRKCQHCEANLSLVYSFPPKWTRTFVGRFFRASLVLFVLDTILDIAIPGFKPLSGAFWLIGLVVIAVLVQIPPFKRSKLVSTYKCENCSRYSAFSETVG